MYPDEHCSYLSRDSARVDFGIMIHEHSKESSL